MVFLELVMACRLAASPTNRSPVLVKATTDGVTRRPSEFSSTTGSPPSITAMHEFVVPKSMPMTLAIKLLLDKSTQRFSEHRQCHRQIFYHNQLGQSSLHKQKHSFSSA